MKARGWGVVGFTLALLASSGCGGSGDGGATAPAISCIDGGPAGENTVTMNCGATTGSTTERVDVMIGGPVTGTTTLRGLSFTVTYDATKLEFIQDETYTSPLFDPSALILAVLGDGGQQGSVVVGIQQIGSVSDVVVTPGQHPVLSLSFRTVAGVSFDPTPLTFVRAGATAASPAIGFADGLALGYPQ